MLRSVRKDVVSKHDAKNYTLRDGAFRASSG